MVSFDQRYVYDIHPCYNLLIFVAMYYTIYLSILPLMNTWVDFYFELLRIIRTLLCMPSGESYMNILFLVDT